MSRECSIEWPQRHRYSYIEGPLFTRDLVDELVKRYTEGHRVIETTLDLGLTHRTVEVRDWVLYIDNERISLRDLSETVEEGFVYKYLGGRIVRVDMYRDNNYYKLRPVSYDKAPTLEINGVQMHRTTDIDPWTDSRIKISVARVSRGDRVLDICTGLGYTAINARRRGSLVFSIEKDRNVLEIASYNPWSRGLEDIEILLGDAVDVIEYIEDECFDVVVHDPPRINIAGELYSLEFYREVYRVLRRGGRLFHYTGEPGRHSNISVLKGIKNRLERAGFTEIRWVEKAKGFYALKI